jgi:hypothetical protein
LVINPSVDVLASKAPSIAHFESREIATLGHAVDSTFGDAEILSELPNSPSG